MPPLTQGPRHEGRLRCGLYVGSRDPGQVLGCEFEEVLRLVLRIWPPAAVLTRLRQCMLLAERERCCTTCGSVRVRPRRPAAGAQARERVAHLNCSASRACSSVREKTRYGLSAGAADTAPPAAEPHAAVVAMAASPPGGRALVLGGAASGAAVLKGEAGSAARPAAPCCCLAGSCVATG